MRRRPDGVKKEKSILRIILKMNEVDFSVFSSSSHSLIPLSALSVGQRGVIESVALKDADSARRMLEMGLIEGSEVEVMHEAPFGGDPIAVRVRGALIGIRRIDASEIRVLITGEIPA